MIVIKKSKNADTRTCDWSKVTKEELLKNSEQHRSDVLRGMLFLAKKIEQAGKKHDHTKIESIDEFHADFQTGFKRDGWWKMHQDTERHHFQKAEFVQDDINLLDVLEQIVDCAMAGLARSGEFRKEELPVELLQKAYNNTVDLMLQNIEVADDELAVQESKIQSLAYGLKEIAK